ncbi:MAG: hypothetical protein JKY51_05010 [Opitutaceae bacterium]|nr:hypothetical protein [Opitutaceae bacterium]
MSKLKSSPSCVCCFFSTLVIIAGFLAFGFIVCNQYSPTLPEALHLGAKTPAERAQLLSEVRSDQSKLTSEYTWIDEEKGTIHLPVDRAMELTLKELQSQEN